LVLTGMFAFILGKLLVAARLVIPPLMQLVSLIFELVDYLRLE
jgi:hypothetical protein